MSKKKQRLWVIGIILIYIGIALVGFLIAYIIKTTVLQSKTPAVVPTPTTAAESTPQETVPADWKVYKNADYKFQLSYPPQNIIKESSHGFGVVSVSLRDPDSDLDFQILLMPKTLAAAVGQNFDTYYALPEGKTTTVKSPLAKDNTTQLMTKIQNRTVASLQAFDYQSRAADDTSEANAEIGTFIQAGNNLILISTKATNSNTLEKLLSSFQYPL